MLSIWIWFDLVSIDLWKYQEDQKSKFWIQILQGFLGVLQPIENPKPSVFYLPKFILM